MTTGCGIVGRRQPLVDQRTKVQKTTRNAIGMAQHTSDDDRYRWLNDRVCAVEGEVRPRPDGIGFDVVLDVSEMVWEAVSAEPG